jgi:hypothetical protein
LLIVAIQSLVEAIFINWAVGEVPDVIEKLVHPRVLEHLAWASANPVTATGNPILLAAGQDRFVPTASQLTAVELIV